MEEFITLTKEEIDKEHLCCAMSDKKHIAGVNKKKEWLKNRINEGHVFRKLKVNGKVFIEYAPLELSWCSIVGENYLYIYCLWVSGSYAKHGYGRILLESAIKDAVSLGKSGVCILSSKKKKPFISDKSFFSKFNFIKCDEVMDYELLALSFDNTYPRFSDSVKNGKCDDDGLVIYYSPQCPYIVNCISEIKEYSYNNNIEIKFIEINSCELAKSVPGVFNNFCLFYNHSLVTTTLQNANSFKKLVEGLK